MRRFMMIAAVCCCLAGGCTESQLEQGDAIVRDVNNIGQAIDQVASGPAGALIPPQVRQIMQLLGIGAAAAYGIWQKIRADLAKQDTRGVIASVDTLLAGPQVANTKKAKEILANDQGEALAARVKRLKVS